MCGVYHVKSIREHAIVTWPARSVLLPPFCQKWRLPCHHSIPHCLCKMHFSHHSASVSFLQQKNCISCHHTCNIPSNLLSLLSNKYRERERESRMKWRACHLCVEIVVVIILKTSQWANAKNSMWAKPNAKLKVGPNANVWAVTWKYRTQLRQIGIAPKDTT